MGGYGRIGVYRVKPLTLSPVPFRRQDEDSSCDISTISPTPFSTPLVLEDSSMVHEDPRRSQTLFDSTIIDNNSDQASETTLTNGNDHSTPKAEGNEGGLPLSQSLFSNTMEDASVAERLRTLVSESMLPPDVDPEPNLQEKLRETERKLLAAEIRNQEKDRII